ncbi:MAG: HAMP domain-containing protein [Sphingomonas sp.]|nr:HAMP domain-containing protein [Sphingomonas sp.]
MRLRRFWPRSLSNQIALLVAIALFVAQAINFALLAEGRRQFRVQQVVGPAAARIIDAEERIAAGRWPEFQLRGRIRLQRADPTAREARRRADVERELKAALAEAGLAVRSIHTEIRPVQPRDPRLSRLGVRRARFFERMGSELVIAVERPRDGGWLVLSAGWPRSDLRLLWPLIGQTLILYIIVLLPVLWAGRRVARPLRALTQAARQFRPGEADAPIEESGPQDLRDVIAAFNALRLRVTAMLEEKDRMLGAIGHDLRTPLAALRVRIESVEDETDRARMADTIAEMNRTLDDILSLARLGRPSEVMTDVDLGALIEAVVEDFRDIGDDVTFAAAPRLTLRLRPSLTRRAVRNLIENAVKYGKSAAVRIEAAPGRVAIIIADQGPGIPPDRLSDVFDPFTRLETSRNRETGGAGLGLALARAIARDAGGDVTLANRPGGGLDATITLPRPA